MTITVFGATGRTGRHILSQGPRRGHQITAFTRRPDILTDTTALDQVIHGDGRDPQAVARAVTGADAVIAIVAAATRKGPTRAPTRTPPRGPTGTPTRTPTRIGPSRRPPTVFTP
jgi:uncharacterized protein YbjT (DUF2867 family)